MEGPKPVNYDQLVDDFIKDSENDDIGIADAYYNLVNELSIQSIIKGFFGSIGSFCGMLF